MEALSDTGDSQEVQNGNEINIDSFEFEPAGKPESRIGTRTSRFWN